ncbi:MAG TPA: PilZ domain-containing protein [Thiotrichales bacterium]|nr:PilZ domain-containing protein [Thiotrichales bacterium]
MQNKRRFERKPVPDNVLLIDEHSGRRIGGLINLSINGLMLLAEQEIAPGTILQTRLALPDAPAPLQLGIEALWTQPSDLEGYHWMGCQILSISELDLDYLQDYLDSLPVSGD